LGCGFAYSFKYADIFDERIVCFHRVEKICTVPVIRILRFLVILLESSVNKMKKLLIYKNMLNS